MTEHALHYARREDVRVADATADALDLLGSAYAIAYTPSACVLARSDRGAFRDSDNQEIPSDTFELRCFDGNGELRWIHQRDGRGTAVLATTDESLLDRAVTRGFSKLPSVSCCAAIKHRYILWGTGTSSAASSGWSVVAEPRIGSLAVPVEGIPEHGRAALMAMEHLRIEDEHGNVGIADELLLGFVPADAKEDW